MNRILADAPDSQRYETNVVIEKWATNPQPNLWTRSSSLNDGFEQGNGVPGSRL
jgi:hypothetical protein